MYLATHVKAAMPTSLSEEMRRALALDATYCAEFECSGPHDLAAYRRQYNHARSFWNQGGPEMGKSEDLVIPGEAGDIPCRLHRPTAACSRVMPTPAIVFAHGGGWVVGSIDTHDRMMREIAERSGFCVIGVDYTLSPEVRFPASHQQVLQVLRHLHTNANRYGLDGDNLHLCGDSAGAHMSLYCALEERDAGHSSIRSLALIYGAFGLRDSISRRIQGGENEGLSSDDMNFYVSSLLGDGVEPGCSGYDLLRRPMQALPPCLITDCILDPLRDDSLALAALLQRYNVPHELIEYAGVLHGYAHLSSAVPTAIDTLTTCASWFCRHSAV